MNRTILLMLMLAGCVSAQAEDLIQTFAVGTGATYSCGKFVAKANTSALGKAMTVDVQGLTYVSEKDSILEYAYGYVTAINMGPRQIAMMDGEAIELWLVNYCTAHPTESFVNALNSFVRSNSKTKQ